MKGKTRTLHDLIICLSLYMILYTVLPITDRFPWIFTVMGKKDQEWDDAD